MKAAQRVATASSVSEMVMKVREALNKVILHEKNIRACSRGNHWLTQPTSWRATSVH